MTENIWIHVGKPLLSIVNRHAVSCGTPPHLHAGASEDAYVSYYENTYGEQLIFVFSYVENEKVAISKKKGLLYHGDCNWEKPYDVFDGIVPDLVLDYGELTWMEACWEACVIKGDQAEYNAMKKRQQKRWSAYEKAVNKKVKAMMHKDSK